jgi:hypothetical protein
LLAGRLREWPLAWYEAWAEVLPVCRGGVAGLAVPGPLLLSRRVLISGRVFIV